VKPRFLIQPALLAVILILAPRALVGQQEKALYPIVEGGKYGYIDEKGKVAIKPKFDDAKSFSEGLARVKVGKKWGFIDATGRLTIEPQFELESFGEANDVSLDFHEVMAAISLKEGKKWGYIDQTGRIIVEPKYDVAGRFSEGLAVVGNTIIDSTKPNETVISIGGAASYIDKRGNIVSLPVVGETFSEGFAVASVPGKRSTYGGGFEGGGVGAVGSGRLTLSDLTKRKKTGYIDKKGQFKIAPRLWVPYSFAEGLARVRADDRDEWGFIDHKGKLIIKMIYQSAGDFCEGLARVTIQGQMGFVDKRGSWAIKPAFSAVGNFSEGLASACVESKNPDFRVNCGYIDKAGRWVIQPTPSFILGDFKGSLAFACGWYNCGYIDKTGKFVWLVSKQKDPQTPIFKSPLTGCSIMSDKAYSNYPCTIDFKLF